MYRVKNDKRIQHSCNRLYQTLVYLIRKYDITDINDVTVLWLTQSATLSRGTFYRHFDKPIDILIWKCDEMVEKSCDVELRLINSIDSIKYFFKYWHSETEFLQCVKQVRVEYILENSLESFFNTWFPMVHSMSNLSESRRKYIARIWANTLWGILVTWASNGYRDSEEELTAIAAHNLPVIS